MRRREPEAKLKVHARGRHKYVYAEVGGKEASRAYIGPKQVQMGPAAVVRMAGIGGVGTNRDHRGKGLARRVYGRVMQEIGKDRYACSGLFTGSVIVAHRLYRSYGYADVMLFPPPAKLLDPRALALKSAERWARRQPLAEWSGVVTLRLEGHPAVHVRFARGEVKALARAPKATDLTLSSTPVGFASLAWGWKRAEYLVTANQLRWEGREEVWQRLLTAVSEDYPAVHGY